MSSVIISQEIVQQTYVELDDVMDPRESYLCQATTSIKLFPGFSYKPINGNDMVMEIDRYSVLPPSEGIYGGINQNDTGVVGALSGTFAVNNMGAAVYSIKVDVPDAIGTIKPNLSLIYNNQAGNGIMGWSWELSGLSSIVRTGQSEYHDDNNTETDFVNDRYMMDGQRLMAVNGCRYGSDKSEYKTEIDHMDRIVAYTNNDNGPECFIVWKSDGTVWEYGTTPDSRVETKNNNKIILKWMLSKVYDRNGNAMLFYYDKNIDQGEAYIDNIQYTCNEDAGVDAAYKISFKYDVKQYDNSFGYVYGNKILNDRLLKNIVIHSNYTGKKLFDYSIEYFEPGTYGNSHFIYHRLKSVGLKVGDNEINPTRIIWNAENKHYDDKFQLYQLNKSVFSNSVPFIGDFNGDGYSDVLLVPYKIQNTYPNDVSGKIYLNNTEGNFYDTPSASVQMSKNLEWIYVFDMNDDGVDDFVSYEYNHEAVANDEDVVTLNFYVSKNGAFENVGTYTYKYNVTLVAGKYMPKANVGLLIIETYNEYRKDRKVEYVNMIDNKMNRYEVYDSSDINNENVDYLAFDMTGDGISELMILHDDGYKVFKMKCENYYGFDLCLEGDEFTKNSYIFPNDYNGDTKTDLLFYESSRRWKIAFSRGVDFEEPASCTNTNLLRTVVLNTKDRYRYSLEELQEPSVTIRTGDFDGDGVADVGVFKDEAGNHYLYVGFKPYVKSGNTCVFAYERRYYMPINYSHQTVQIGRFLSQENISILSGLPRNPMNSQKAYITSLFPQTAYYSVERIIDGMGNIRGFSYDYLMQKKYSQENFYSSSNDITNNDIRRIAVPIAALRTDTVFTINETPLVTKYEYYNALIHSKGHGFVGFERMTSMISLNDRTIRKIEKGMSTDALHDYSVAIPSYMIEYVNENYMQKFMTYEYKCYTCQSNEKVIMPLQIKNYEYVYNPDKLGELLKINVEEKSYFSDIGLDEMYDNVVSCASMTKGFTDDNSVKNVLDCQFTDNDFVVYYKNDIDNWVINRPSMIYKYKQDSKGDVVGSVKRYMYDDKVPTRIVEEVNIPNYQGDIDDPLTATVGYEYDKVGNIVKQTYTSKSVGNVKVVKSEYGTTYNYMFKTKITDELGRETKCNYDTDFGYLVSTVDYNGFVTSTDKDPLGINDMVTLPDGMVRARAVRWVQDNEHAPLGATFYTWEKGTGTAENMIFYHKSGAELRSVSFDINGNAVYRDKKYDDYGNMIQESLPYYKGGEKYYVNSIYDNYNRLVEKRLPNSLICNISYDGNTVIKEFVSTNGDRKTTKETYNLMGWMTNVDDMGGNEIVYEYYSDGLVKSAMIEKNKNSKITVTYDNLRNKRSLYDPNYGQISYQYDALGNIIKVSNPNGGVREYEYDVLGRLSSVIEISSKNVKPITTRWIYYDEKGKDGMLRKVMSDNHVLEYIYDDCLRMMSTKETIKGKDYTTSYKYDKANRINTITYPSGLVLSKVFSNAGYEKELYDGKTLLWKTNKTTADGSVSEYQLGNGVVTNITYDSYTSLIESISSYNEKECIQDLEYKYDDWGNMLLRSQKSDVELMEEFEYDGFDRLVDIKMNGRSVSTMKYDFQGNIIEKKEKGMKVLYSTLYDSSRPNALLYAKTDDKKMLVGIGSDMKYSAFDNLISLTQGDNVLEIEYGNDNARVFMEAIVDGKRKSKTYIGDCEFVEEDGRQLMHTYINGPAGVFAVCSVDEKGNRNTNYIHKDNLGSWNVITDDEANVIQNVAFDAWGNVRSGTDWSLVNCSELLYDIGFTGHEHLCAFGLINMNGRIYDPMLSMMLSPDNNIQIPHLSQNFNRYSYCLNNPLKYTDPTGEWIESVVMGVVGGAANLVLNAKYVDTFGEGAVVFGVGFLKGFLAEYTAGQSWFLQVGVNTLMSGVTSGVNQMVTVGDGSFKFSGDDWNSIRTAACYGLGSALVNNFMFTYMTPPTEEDYGTSLFEMCYDQELAYGVISAAAHGMGCWFSGQPFLTTIRFKDVGFDLKMLGIIAEKMLASYIQETDFADKAMGQRTQEIKDSVMEYVLSENPDHPDFECYYQLREICVDKCRVYVVGDVFALLPGEIIEIYPIPYLEEVVSFPFSYSLFKSLFFNDND